MTTPGKPVGTLDTALVERCFEQIERESAGLAMLTALAQQLRHAIGASASEGWAAALRLQDVMAANASALHEQRQTWRAAIAAELAVTPEQVTLSAIAARLDAPRATASLQARDRLRAQLQDFSRLNGFNLLLVRAHLEALRRFFLDLTGASAAPGRYNRAGAAPAPARGSLVQTKG